MTSVRHTLIALSALLAFAANAHEYKIGSIAIDHPFARATVAGQAAGGGFMTMTNAGPTDRLLSVSGTLAKAVELHSMSMEGDVMRMREVPSIELPTGKTVALKPGGLHMMFVGLKAPLKVGDSHPITLRFEKAGVVTVDVKVEAAGAAPAMQGQGEMHKH